MLCVALLALGALAAVSLWLSALSQWLAAPASLLALGYGAWLARREFRREPFVLAWRGGASEVELNFAGRRQSWSAPQVQLRGPLASLSARDGQGRRRRVHWWPDTLPSASRRALRLAAGANNETVAAVLAATSG